MERAGPEGFSLRKAAQVLGCDPAALIYHFGSREGLERAVADRLHARITRLDAKLSWRERLTVLSRQYRTLAQTFPRTFPLLMRYWTTGPRDLVVADDCYIALADAGVPAAQIPAVECGLYAALLGLCAGEAGGLIGRPAPGTIAEIKAEEGLAATRALLNSIRSLDADQVFEDTIGVLLEGVAAKGRRRPARAKPKRKTVTARGGR